MKFLTACASFLAVVVPTAAQPPPVGGAASRPNIVFILADDLGWGDVRCYNPDGKIPTPHLDRLAAGGLRFTDAHSPSSVCTPTRYGILTGRYAWRSRLKSSVLGGLSPALIEPGRLTVAQLLHDRGYATAVIGKWHLGLDWVVLPGKSVTELGIETEAQGRSVDYAQPFRRGPLEFGFDEFFGIAGSLDMVPYTYLAQDRVAAAPTTETRFPMNRGAATPASRLGPAAPGFEAQDVLPEFTRRATDFIARAAPDAKKGRPFFLYLPLNSPHTPSLPTDEFHGKSRLNAYADFVIQTDETVGAVVAALEKAGVADDTLVLFTSDNGCSPYADFSFLAAQGHRPSAHWRGHKADLYEGGHRVPLIARWPRAVPAGTVSDRTVALSDFMATAAEMVGATLPPEAAEDSVSFLPTLRGQKEAPPRGAVVHHSIDGSFAIREGRWKFLLAPGSGGWSFPRPDRDDTSALPASQLFDLAADPAETRNLIAEHPEIATRLERLLERYVAEGRSTPGPRQSNTTRVTLRATRVMPIAR